MRFRPKEGVMIQEIIDSCKVGRGSLYIKAKYGNEIMGFIISNEELRSRS
jgi:hypothetical protein